MKQSGSSSEERSHYYYPSTAALAEKDTALLNQPSAPPYYGTFQGNPSYPQPSNPSQHYAYHTVQGYPVVEGTPVVDRELQRLPCCGIGIGWFLFIVGWFLATVPWFIGAFLFVCTRQDYRERIGLVLCTIAATLSLIAAAVGGSRARY
ncbi:hypothetical protein GOP47_0030250 [Adiantum capillus-veneris]|nr:hypothetical protein GOP47_0030250 [Adiantum capillus-veneris]